MKDPAFLFYDGDAARDVSHMNRLERGCYFDLIQAQRKFGGYTVEQAKKILGRDFEECWPSLEMILSCDNGRYFIEWVENSANKRKEYAEKQRKRIQDYWDNKKEKELNRGNTTVLPLENENVIENKDAIELNTWSKDFFDIKYINSKSYETYDKLLRIDNYSIEQIKSAIKFARGDAFWNTNFLTPNKLRDKDKVGVKYIDVFLAKIKPIQQKSTFIPSPR